MIVIATVGAVCLLLFFLSFQRQMAALVGWIVGLLVGSGDEPPPPPPVASEKKTRLRKPPSSTNLSAQIDNIIEEAVSEEEPPIKEPTKKNKKIVRPSSTRSESLDSEDNVGFSFFKLKPKEKSRKNVTPKEPQKKPTTNTIEEATLDDSKLPFIPVKSKGKKSRAKPYDEPVKTTKQPQEKPSNIRKEISELLDECSSVNSKSSIRRSGPVEVRESKKVLSSLSYANILTNKLEAGASTSQELTESNWKELFVENLSKLNGQIESSASKVERSKDLVVVESLVEEVPNEIKSLNETLTLNTTIEDCIEKTSLLENTSQSYQPEDYWKVLEAQLLQTDPVLLDCLEKPQEEKEKPPSETPPKSLKLNGNINNLINQTTIADIAANWKQVSSEDYWKELEAQLLETECLSPDGCCSEIFPGLDNGVEVTSSTNSNESLIHKNLILEPNLEDIEEDFNELAEEELLAKITNFETTSKTDCYVESFDKIELVQDTSLADIQVEPLHESLNQAKEQIKDSNELKEANPSTQLIQIEPITEETELLQEDVKETLTNFNKIEDEEISSDQSRTKRSTNNESNQKTCKINQTQQINMTQIRVLTLNHLEHQESTLYRLKKGWTLQFRLGPSLLGSEIKLYCNYPVEGQFIRNKYYGVQWQQEEGCQFSDDTALYAQLSLKLPGSFHYYFTNLKGEQQGSGFFIVDPTIQYGNAEELPLDCVQCQTVLAKGLGSFSSWDKKLQVSKEAGYNMIHFTPIQALGASNSSYSLREQHKLNPIFIKNNSKMPSFDEVEELLNKIRTEWKVASICDIVLNHTANESDWLQEHPEATYNCSNCPYMRPAYLMDAALHFFSMDVKNGLYEDRGIPAQIETEDHINSIKYHLRSCVLEPLKLHEMFTCDTVKLVAEFSELCRKSQPTPSNENSSEVLELIQDPEYRRLATKIDMKLALELYNSYWPECFDEDSRLRLSAEQFRNRLNFLNDQIRNKIEDHLNTAINNTVAGIRYFRVQQDGPKYRDITISTPLIYRYFTEDNATTIKESELILYGEKGKFLMAHNGWVMEADPLKNFADADSNVYLRRELIAWGDSVKLRYGNKPEDSPFLWDHMKKYVELTAKIFDGVRLDNCHSTPLNVAEYLLDCARRVKPDLYVVAELFTNSDTTDNIFINRLGINSLIREALSAWDSHEQGRLVYRYGGQPVGSFHQPAICPLTPSIAHALFLDLTHDNPSPVDKRSIFDLLPSTALVNMACCASGSSRGYDELVPHHIHVVDEVRSYTEWTDNPIVAEGNPQFITHTSGIIPVKKALNNLHFTMGLNGFNQVYVDQMDGDIVAVTRHCPETHQSYILVAFTAFQHPSSEVQRNIKPLRVEGLVEEIVLEATLSHVDAKTGSKYKKSGKFEQDKTWINGLNEYVVEFQENISVGDSKFVKQVNSNTDNVTQLNFEDFKPGSVIVVRVSLPEKMQTAVETLRKTVQTEFSPSKPSELREIISQLTLVNLNRVLNRCDQEERDEGLGFDTYNIPNYGKLVYAGLQGMMSLLAKIRPSNDLGHPFCGNLRDGNWMIEYVWKRLKLNAGTAKLGAWIEVHTKSFEDMPRYLVPAYFDLFITSLYCLLVEQCYFLMPDFVLNGSTFVKGLSLGSVQMMGFVQSSCLPDLSKSLTPAIGTEKASFSAGLPHFSVGYMRNWGRDTFIALRGLLILTGRFDEARQHILGYASCLRHGLIPNLLDSGRNPRFNCRDAVWWWLYCIKEYAEEAPKGADILQDKVSRIFPKDDSPAQPVGQHEEPLYKVIQEALTVHFQGLVFRERNAGKQIDEHMTDQGFNNRIGVHPETGFVFGGNEWNCGTWMDKMGSSDKAGNRGKPGTPRDGSAVELIGLSKAVISWLSKLSKAKTYPFNGVKRTHKDGSVTEWSFEEWANKIQNNFEKCFWIDEDKAGCETKPHLVNKRGIYKDCFGATQEWTDYQLRCNFPITMVVAPELFDPQHAWTALQLYEKHLVGPLGVKTLDPEDWAYNGDYDNSNDSTDFKLANGFNYHQGPEWVWPLGFFLRAKLHFASKNNALSSTINEVKTALSAHFVELQTSDWRGLPELTNKNGSYCADSSRTQAWSISCILEVLKDLQNIESRVN